LTLVEVLMSMLVTGIGVLSVITLLPLSFIRAVQATNLTNGTILRYNAEGQIDVNPRLLLRWQPNSSYAAGDVIVLTTSPPTSLKCTAAGTSGLQAPAIWNTAAGATTADNGVVWTAAAAGAYNTPSGPSSYPQPFVVDPLGWNTLGAVQGSLGNNAGTVDPQAVLRFNGEATSQTAAAQLVTLSDSWIEQARGPVTAFTQGQIAPPIAGSATLSGPDLSAVGVPPQVVTRVVLLDQTGKFAHTRLVNSITSPAVSWPSSDPLPNGFTPVSARVETQEMRYTYLLTVQPNGGTSNVSVTVFFRRSLTPNDEQVYQTTGNDGVQTPFIVKYTGAKPFTKKGGFLFDCYFGRWYRITNITNDTGSQMSVYVDQPRPQTDLALPNSGTFGSVFMRGVVDVFPLVPK